MVKAEGVKLVLSELDGRLAHRGLGGLRYELVNWWESLYLVFPAELSADCDKDISAVVKAVARALPDYIDAKRSSFVREEPDDEDGSDEDLSESGDETSDDDDYPPEIAAQIAALPHFPIDEFWDKMSKGVPYVEIWVKKRFVERSEMEDAYDQTEEERERLEDEAVKMQNDEYERAHPFTLLPIPPPPKTRNTEVYLTMAYEPYDDIENGEKLTEFREYSEYYVKKLLSQPIKTIRFQRGYGGPGHDAPRQMRWSVKDIDYYNINTRKSAPLDNVPEGFRPTHIAIDLDARID